MRERGACTCLRVGVLGTRGVPGIPGGVETHCEEMYPRMTARVRVIVFARSPYVGHGRTVARVSKNVVVVRLPCPKTRSLEAVVHTALALIVLCRKRMAVAHFHGIGPALLSPFARGAGATVVLTHHGRDYLRAKWGRVARGVLRLGEYLGVRASHGVIAISRGIAEHCLRLGRPDVRHIPNGVTTLPNVPAGEARVLLERFGLKAGRYVFAAGRLVPEKGFEELIAVARRIERASGLKVVIGGSENHPSEFGRELVKSAEREGVAMLGRLGRSEVAVLLDHCRVFVTASRFEGLPIALLEALSRGCAVVASDICPHREIGVPSECLFRVGDADALVRVVHARSRSPETNSWDQALAPFDWRAIAEATERLYFEVFRCGPLRERSSPRSSE